MKRAKLLRGLRALARDANDGALALNVLYLEDDTNPVHRRASLAACALALTGYLRDSAEGIECDDAMSTEVLDEVATNLRTWAFLLVALTHELQRLARRGA